MLQDENHPRVFIILVLHSPDKMSGFVFLAQVIRVSGKAYKNGARTPHSTLRSALHPGKIASQDRNQDVDIYQHFIDINQF